MITVPVTDLKKGDRVRFTGNNGPEYELDQDPQAHSSELGLIILSFTNNRLGVLTMPTNVELAATRMVRTVTVRCPVQGGHDVRVLVDLATSVVPRAVLCGECDERITAQVLANMAAQEVEIEDATGEKDFSA